MKPGTAAGRGTTTAFARDGQERWRQLERLLDRAENVTARELGAAGVRELLALYRQACADLSQARTLVTPVAATNELFMTTSPANNTPSPSTKKTVSPRV